VEGVEEEVVVDAEEGVEELGGVNCFVGFGG